MPHSAESKGTGWGGPARGKGNHGPGPGRPRKDVSALIQAAREERLAALKEHILDLAFTADRQETQLSAAVAYLDREEGKPVQRQDVTSGGQRLGYVIAAPAEAEDAEQWARQNPAPR